MSRNTLPRLTPPYNLTQPLFEKLSRTKNMYHSELLCTKGFNTLPITNYLLIHALLLNIVPKFVQAYAKSGYRIFHTTVEEAYCLLSKSSIPILSVFPLAETISLCWELSFCVKKTYDGMYSTFVRILNLLRYYKYILYSK